MKVYILVRTAHACTTIVSTAIDIHTFYLALVQLYFYSQFTSTRLYAGTIQELGHRIHVWYFS